MKSNLLKAERVKAGLTQTDIAKIIGKDVSSYSKKENNKVEFTASEIMALKKILKLTPELIDEIFFNYKFEFNSSL